MGLAYHTEDHLTQQQTQIEGYGKCYTCNQLSAITYTVNDKGQAIADSKKCFSCIELGN